MNDIETAWVAGLLEGEGSFVITSSRPPRVDGYPARRVLTVTCSSTDKDIIDKLERLTEMGRRYMRDPTKFATVQGKKIQYTWQVGKRADIIKILRVIRPHMGERRGQKIDDMLALAEAPPIPRAPHPTCSKGCSCDKHTWRQRRRQTVGG